MSNRGSRKGIGVDRSDLDYIKAMFQATGIQFTESEKVARKLYDVEFQWTGKQLATHLNFETTTLVFDRKGRYAGRIYVARDECDYFNPRVGAETPPTKRRRGEG